VLNNLWTQQSAVNKSNNYAWKGRCGRCFAICAWKWSVFHERYVQSLLSIREQNRMCFIIISKSCCWIWDWTKCIILYHWWWPYKGWNVAGELKSLMWIKVVGNVLFMLNFWKLISRKGGQIENKSRTPLILCVLIPTSVLCLLRERQKNLWNIRMYIEPNLIKCRYSWSLLYKYSHFEIYEIFQERNYSLRRLHVGLFS
jgi:hypothetical protein